MAFQTDASIQSALDSGCQGVVLTRRVRTDATHEALYVIPKIGLAGRARFVDVDPTDTAANQAALVATAIGT